MVSNINEFIKETNKEIEKLQAKQVSEAKNIVLGAYNTLVEFSPVDKGQFRNNHFLTVNSTTQETTEETNLTKKTSDLNSCKFNSGDSIYIQNNLKYADALEAGHSEQAPAGVYGVTERKIEKQLAKDIKI